MKKPYKLLVTACRVSVGFRWRQNPFQSVTFFPTGVNMIQLPSLIVNVGIDSYINYPENGYLKYPYSILKTFGALSRTCSAMWAMETGRNPIRTPAPLARNGCVPVDTLKKQLRTLVTKEFISFQHTDKGFEYMLTRNAYETMYAAYQASMPHIQIPRRWFHYWPNATFSELLLLGFYRFKCSTSWGDGVECKLTHLQIADLIGFSSDTWKRASKGLEDRGMIVRRNQRQGYAVSLSE